MSKRFKYTLYKADGTEVKLGILKEEMPLDQMYKHLNCGTVELIPRNYYPLEELNNFDVRYYGDEEARMKDETNVTNEHFKVLYDVEGNAWDVVGDVLREEAVQWLP